MQVEGRKAECREVGESFPRHEHEKKTPGLYDQLESTDSFFSFFLYLRCWCGPAIRSCLPGWVCHLLGSCSSSILSAIECHSGWRHRSKTLKRDSLYADGVRAERSAHILLYKEERERRTLLLTTRPRERERGRNTI